MSDKKIIFSMSKVKKVYPPKLEVIKDISLSFYYGAKIGVLGYNGTGKSSLLKIISGEDQEYSGDVALSKGISVGRMSQEVNLDPDKTVLEVVKEGAKETVELLKKFDEINEKFAEPMSDDAMNKLLENQAKVQDQLDACNAWDLDSRLELSMDSLRCPPPETKCGSLSGGERRRVYLCKLLLESPDVLLLDEPTNHLDAETVFWLENHLEQYPGTIIAVTHDRYFLDNVAGWILELDRGKGIPFEGNYSSWLEQKRKRLAVEEKQESKRQKSLAREFEWIKSSPKARHAKSKSRIKNYEQLYNQDVAKTSETKELFIPKGPRLGDVVIEAKNVTKAFGDKLLFENLSFKLPPGGIVGVIGPNGAGKTTLFKMITGQEEPNEGSFTIGDTVKLSYVDQDRQMNPDKNIIEEISDGKEVLNIGGRELNIRAYISKFNFTGEAQKKKIGTLSGGEKNRAHLAKLLQQESNVLLLDEPTNDLDVNTLRALEEALDDFAGCAVVISHDRYFLDRVATHILAFEGEGQVNWFDGNFSEYEEDRKKRLGSDADRPKRLKYKKFTR
jgi:energy-dependent translational throttle protein EttA